jgi:hypothetical protein
MRPGVCGDALATTKRGGSPQVTELAALVLRERPHRPTGKAFSRCYDAGEEHVPQSRKEPKAMAKVAREMVERAGVDVEELVELLVNNAGAELTTYYYYTILRVNLIGLEGEGLSRSPRRRASRTETTSRPWCRASTSWAVSCPGT